MSDLLTILSITGPIYLAIAAGWFSVQRGLFTRADMRTFGTFVVHIALPALLFNAVAQRRFGEILNPTYLGAYALGSLATIGVGMLLMRRGLGRSRSESACAVMGMACPNSGYVGYPVMLLTLPSVAGVSLALNMLVENVLVLPLLLALAARGDDPAQAGSIGAVVRGSLAQMLKMPMVLALLAGLVVSALQIELPSAVSRTVTLFAQASSAVSLFVIGGTLCGLSLRGLAPKVAPIVAGKLLLHPLLIGAALLAVTALGLPGLSLEMREALLLTSAMPIMGIYPILAQRHGQDGPAAAALLATTIGSFVTLNGLLWGIQQIG